MKNVISNHVDIFLDHDIFKKDRTRITQVLDHKRMAQPKEFLESYWDLALISHDKKCNGFRFNTWDDPSEVPFTCVNDEYKIIMIKRNNIFNGMLDCAFAHNTGIWHIEKEVESIDKFSIDYEWAKKWIHGATSTYNSWKNFYDENGIKYLEVTYEDIYSGSTMNLDSIFDYLEVDRFLTTPKNTFIKVSIEKIYDAVINKDQIDRLKPQ